MFIFDKNLDLLQILIKIILGISLYTVPRPSKKHSWGTRKKIVEELPLRSPPLNSSTG